ncbi:isochorismate synthase MenF [Corynebacterium ulcerans]|uniref:isochorismate synthase n=1 Tax=Corynebacterium ulcerans TaxID=65058 RepID=A0ABD0BK12_CORUL|nr:isochorismate synthase [Corynebacterium ulcerans]KPH76601.1 isochorismate synthase [Corynebacterium ulcerans]MBH5295577.1 isochorismate synthase [Corynebacterium ulcerans]MBH5298790.1 isochorismate synthase [Corynebacterium ulcerans]MDK8889351.1 isochorismate synthase [Corynebacterium ulcerans]OIS08879.1 isochorismate synthase [Corynebacterium ulcerans]
MCAHRPSTAPDFLLSRAHGSIRTQGAQKTFSDPWEAIEALHNGTADLVVGALPFRRDHACALAVPETVIREEGPLEPHAYYRHGEGSVMHAHLDALVPELDEHRDRVIAAIETLKASTLEKVVLARAVDMRFDPPVDPRLIAARLIDLSQNRDGFIADLSPAGEDFVGAMLVGSSPEVLIKKQGSTISAYPLAGSAPRNADKLLDARAGEELRRSPKDLAEHSYVVDHLRTLLAPLCSSLDIPQYPELTRTNEMWHLATPVVGTLKDPAMTALELALVVHPTPAICGTPTDAAEEIIGIAEGDRRFYSGAVGWSDAAGDGEYMVAIRCAEVNGSGTAARAWAGGGIVADSDADAEVEETSAKLRTIMRALGL